MQRRRARRLPSFTMMLTSRSSSWQRWGEGWCGSSPSQGEEGEKGLHSGRNREGGGCMPGTPARVLPSKCSQPCNNRTTAVPFPPTQDPRHPDPFIPSVFVSQRSGLMMRRLTQEGKTVVELRAGSEALWLSMVSRDKRERGRCGGRTRAARHKCWRLPAACTPPHNPRAPSVLPLAGAFCRGRIPGGERRAGSAVDGPAAACSRCVRACAARVCSVCAN